MDGISPQETNEYGAVDDGGADLDGEYESGLVEAGVRTVVTEVRKKQVEQMHQAIKDASISFYMLKTPYLIAQVFKQNNKSQKNIFNNMCDFGARAQWSIGRRYVSYYLDVETRKYQNHLLNPTHLD